MKEPRLITDLEAVALHAQLRAMPLLHASDEGDRGCDKRAHRICQMIAEYGPKKAWMTSVNTNNQVVNFNLRQPDAEIPGVPDSGFNFHVSPMVLTDSGKEVMLDIFYYETPPTRKEWERSFVAVAPNTRPLVRVTSPQVYSFQEMMSNKHPSRGIRGMFENARHNLDLRLASLCAEIHPHGFPLKSKWVDHAMLQAAGVGEEPAFLKRARGNAGSTTNAALYYKYLQEQKTGGLAPTGHS